MDKMNDRDVELACARFGAKVVSDAAYTAMNGNRDAIERVGLGSASHLRTLLQITEVAFSLMSPSERASDLTEAVILAAKISGDRGA